MTESNDLPMKPRLLRSRTVYQGDKLTLRVDTLRMGDRSPTDKEIIEHAGSAVIVPLLNEETLLLINQWRPAAGMYMLELPSGTIEKGETPRETAQRELREEAGHRAEEIVPIGGFWPVSGYSEEYSHGFVARGLKYDPLPQDKLEDIRVEEMPISDLPRMVRDSEIDDALTIAVLMRWMLLESAFSSEDIFSKSHPHQLGRCLPVRSERSSGHGSSSAGS